MDLARRTLINEALVRLADGDRSSFTVLMDELWPVLLSFASRLIGERPSIEDVYMEEQLGQALADALDTLSDSDREALGVTERTQLSGEISDTAIRKRRQRAVTKLRSLWSHLYG